MNTVDKNRPKLDPLSSVVGHYVVFIEATSFPVSGVYSMYEQLADTSRDLGYLIPQHHKVANEAEFIKVLEDLSTDVTRTGYFPMIHVDAHGHAEAGVAIDSTGSSGAQYMSWMVLADALGKLNKEMGNQLLVTFGVCHAFLLNGEVNLKKPAPYSLAFAPTADVYEALVIERLPIFYDHFLSGDVDSAFEIISTIFDPFSSEYFLKQVLIDSVSNSIGRKGRDRVDMLLTQVVDILGPEAVKITTARRGIKNSLKVTDESLIELSEIYRCGRAMPYNAQEIHALARKQNKSR